MICLGLAAFLVAASPGEGTRVPDARQWLVAVGTRGLAVAVLLLLARRGSPGRRATFFGAATSIVWSVDAAFVKQSVDALAHAGVLGLLTSWACYAMIATGVLGTVLLQGSYAAGPLAASSAAMLIVDPLASIALGAELFSEQLRTSPGYALGAAASLAVLAAGVVMLSIWAPPTMTAEQLARLPGQARSGEDDRSRGSLLLPSRPVEDALYGHPAHPCSSRMASGPEGAEQVPSDAPGLAGNRFSLDPDHLARLLPRAADEVELASPQRFWRHRN